MDNLMRAHLNTVNNMIWHEYLMDRGWIGRTATGVQQEAAARYLRPAPAPMWPDDDELPF